jgi:hypothetical protein
LLLHDVPSLPTVLALLALVSLPGCYSYRTVAVIVVDAETRLPIRGAEVRTNYNQGLAHAAPTTSHAVTGPDGRARVHVAKDAFGIFILPKAEGYLDYWAGGVYPDGRPYDSNPYTELPAWPFDAVTLTLYAQPDPTVVLVAPEGYKGLIPLAEGHGTRGNPWPGRRVFEIQWKPGETARLRDLPQLRWAPLVVNHVRYAGGQEIPFAPHRTTEVGWWYSGARQDPGGVTVYLLIGTSEDRRPVPGDSHEADRTRRRL